MATTPLWRAAAFALHDPALVTGANYRISFIQRAFVSPLGHRLRTRKHPRDCQLNDADGHLPEEPETKMALTLAWLTSQSGVCRSGTLRPPDLGYGEPTFTLTTEPQHTQRLLERNTRRPRTSAHRLDPVVVRRVCTVPIAER